MAGFVKIGSNSADAVTGERIFPGETVFDTGLKNKRSSFIGNTRTRMLKEDTIVWLAEQAGYDVIKRDAGDSGNAEVVDGENAGVGDGTLEAGEDEAGRKPAAKRRSNGTTKGK